MRHCESPRPSRRWQFDQLATECGAKTFNSSEAVDLIKGGIAFAGDSMMRYMFVSLLQLANVTGACRSVVLATGAGRKREPPRALEESEWRSRAEGRERRRRPRLVVRGRGRRALWPRRSRSRAAAIHSVSLFLSLSPSLSVSRARSLSLSLPLPLSHTRIHTHAYTHTHAHTRFLSLSPRAQCPSLIATRTQWPTCRTARPCGFCGDRFQQTWWSRRTGGQTGPTRSLRSPSRPCVFGTCCGRTTQASLRSSWSAWTTPSSGSSRR